MGRYTRKSRQKGTGVVLPGVVAPVELPFFSATEYISLTSATNENTRITRGGNTRIDRAGNTRITRGITTYTGLYPALAFVELPGTVAPVELEDE